MEPIPPVIDHSAEDSSTSQLSSSTSVDAIPSELWLNIWSSTVEPRIVLFNDLASTHRSYPLPGVTQVNVEARNETRQGYEPVGRGSYFHFGRDILVCDHRISDSVPDPFLEELAPRIKRVAYWDCFPDDRRVDGPYHYSRYLSACYRQRGFGTIEFDHFWFPNIEELWIVKIGEVDPTWMVHVDRAAPNEVRERELAKQFRFWVGENIIEMAPLDLAEPEVKAILTEGRCEKLDCHQLNEGRTRMVSKVTFLDGKYQAATDGTAWVRILPWQVNEQVRSQGSHENRLRWVLAERILTFDLSFEPSIDSGSESESETPSRGRGRGMQ